MLDVLSAAVRSLAAGALLGGFFYGGLWLTVVSLPSSRRPMLLAFGSFLFRASVVVALLSWLAEPSVLTWLLALTSFLGTRGWLTLLVSRI